MLPHFICTRNINLLNPVMWSVPTWKDDFHCLISCLQQIKEILVIFSFSFVAEKFTKLQVAKDILTNEESRIKYDKWLNAGVAIPFEVWNAHNSHIHSVCMFLYSSFLKSCNPKQSFSDFYWQNLKQNKT